MTIYLKEWRNKKEMSRAQLVRKSNVSRATIWYLENNPEHAPKMDTLEKLANAMNIKVASLFSMPK